MFDYKAIEYIFINGNKLQNPWTGGANSPVISQIDLDGDGKLDLTTFDTDGNRLSCYLNIGQSCSGSVLWAFDYECDNDIDLLNGDILGSNLLFLQNSAPPDSMVYQDSLFPNYDTPVQIGNIPCPSMFDVDNDGKKDLVITPLENGEDYNNVLLYNNQGDNCNPNFNLTTHRFLVDQMIDVGNSSAPELIDADRDGLLDLVIGERAGNLNYYHNIGTASTPLFDVPNILFGGVNVTGLNSIMGNSVPIMFDNNGSYELLVGSESGYIYDYNNIDGNLGGSFTLLDTAFQNIYEPSHATIALADIDGDSKFDLLVGCEAGGVRLYTQCNNILSTEIKWVNDANFSLFPSPATDEVTIKMNDLFSSVSTLQIVDVLGNTVMNLPAISSSLKVNITKLDSGIYFVRMITANGENIQKFIKL